VSLKIYLSPADVCDPILLEALRFDGFDEICDAARTAILHHQPQLIVLHERELRFDEIL